MTDPSTRTRPASHRARPAKRPTTSPAAPTIDVPNPLYQPGHPAELRTIRAARATRDDPLARLHARRQIGDAQYRAGRIWQRAYEVACLGQIGAIDAASQPVDGSPPHRGPDIDRILKAAKLLASWDRILGSEGRMLVRDVLADRLTIADVTHRRGFASEPYWGQRFRECLSSLARAMNLVVDAWHERS